MISPCFCYSEDEQDEGSREDPNEGERLAKEHHDRAVELDRDGPPEELEVDLPPQDGDEDSQVLHDRLQEDEMEARWKEKKHVLVGNVLSDWHGIPYEN